MLKARPAADQAAHCEGKRLVRLAWDSNAEPDLAGYRLYMSNLSGDYNKGDFIAEIPAGSETYTAEIMRAGLYFFVLTAYDTASNESDFDISPHEESPGCAASVGSYQIGEHYPISWNRG